LYESGHDCSLEDWLREDADKAMLFRDTGIGGFVEITTFHSGLPRKELHGRILKVGVVDHPVPQVGGVTDLNLPLPTSSIA
jgi:hypothetical protein